jgi:DNA-binding MarR family transcriptional regulator
MRPSTSGRDSGTDRSAGTTSPPELAETLSDQIAETARQWVTHDWPLPSAMVTVTSVMRASQIVTSRMEAALSTFDLTVARYEILIMLYFSRKGQLPLSKIGERLQVHQTSVTRVVDGLVTLGYVHRENHPTDRRISLAVLTESGRATLTKAKTEVATALFENLGVDVQEQRQLITLLNKIRATGGDDVDEEGVLHTSAGPDPGQG